MLTLMDVLDSVDLSHFDQVSEMTLKTLRQVLLVLLLTSCFAAFSSGVAFAQLPFGNLTPGEDDEAQTGGPESGAPFAQEGPMRPIDRQPVRPADVRPEDDELGADEEPEQSVEVKERFAGWQGAGSVDGERLSDTLRANWVMLDRNGKFTGTVRGVDGADVAGMTVFLMNNGRLVKTAAVQGDGSFVFTNVQRGAYSLVGWGDKAFFAFGANIINDNPDADDSTPTSIECYAFQNETTINTDWIRYFAPNIAYRVFGRYSVEEGADDPDHLYGFEGLNSNVVAAQPATSISGIPVKLDDFGRLVGRVHQMNSINGRPVDLRSTKVMLLKGDDVIGSTTTDNFGVFQFGGVRPGGYGLLAVGVDGVGLVGIQVAGEEATVIDEEGFAAKGEGATFDFTMVSSETVGWLNHYATDVAYRKAILQPRPIAYQGPQYNDPMPIKGNQFDDPYCRSPCITYGEWVQRGCACKGNKSVWLRIGDRVRDRVEALDDRFEDAFYGESNYSGPTPYQNVNPTGYGQQPFSKNASQAKPAQQAKVAPVPPIVKAQTPPIVQPGQAPKMPMARANGSTSTR